MLRILFYYSPHGLIVGLFQRVLNHSCLPQHEALMWVEALGRSFSADSFILPMEVAENVVKSLVYL